MDADYSLDFGQTSAAPRKCLDHAGAASGLASVPSEWPANFGGTALAWIPTALSELTLRSVLSRRLDAGGRHSAWPQEKLFRGCSCWHRPTSVRGHSRNHWIVLLFPTAPCFPCPSKPPLSRLPIDGLRSGSVLSARPQRHPDSLSLA